MNVDRLLQSTRCRVIINSLSKNLTFAPQYYHTITASPSRRPSAMAKVMEMFRGRASVPGQNVPIEGADRRKAVSTVWSLSCVIEIPVLAFLFI